MSELRSRELPAPSCEQRAAGCMLRPHTLPGKLCWGGKPVFISLFSLNSMDSTPLAKFRSVPEPGFVLQAAPWAPCCLFAVKSQCRFCASPIPILVSVSCRIQAADVSLKALTKLIQLLNLQLCPR